MVKNIFRGAAIGMIETVPGVSGSTIAMILGIYEKLIYSLSVLTTKERMSGIPFLFTLGIGMAVGFAGSLFTISYFLSHYRTPTFIFFVGIIVGFLPYLWKEAVTHTESSFKLNHYFIMVFFFSLVVVVQLSSGFHTLDAANLTFDNYIFLAVAGFIASTALVLPGISGALMLTILGVYELAASSLVALYFPVVLPIVAGVILGVLLTSKLVRYLLIHYTQGTYSAMIGLVAGSIIAIFYNIEGAMNTGILLSSILTFLAGFGLVWILKQVQHARFSS